MIVHFLMLPQSTSTLRLYIHLLFSNLFGRRPRLEKKSCRMEKNSISSCFSPHLVSPQTLLAGLETPLAGPKTPLAGPQTPLAGTQTPLVGPQTLWLARGLLWLTLGPID